MKGGERPTDGAFVTFWRILVEHPEVLAWERLWNEGLRDTYRAMYRNAHEIAPQKPMGWHIWHTNSFAPFYRAEQDYRCFREFSDFLKVVMYHNSGGPRMARYIQNVNSTLFADLTPEQTTEFTYRVQQYPSEAALDKLPTAGLRPITCGGKRAAPSRALRAQDENLAGHRDRHSHRRERKEDDARRCVSGGQGDVRRGRTRHHPVA